MVVDAVRSVAVGSGRRRVDAVLGQEGVEEPPVLLGDELGEGGGAEPVALLHTGQLLRDEDVNAVGLPADGVVDPPQLDLELLGGERRRPEDPEAPAPGDGGHDVAAVAEGEDGILDAELIADAGAHGGNATP